MQLVVFEASNGTESGNHRNSEVLKYRESVKNNNIEQDYQMFAVLWLEQYFG